MRRFLLVLLGLHFIATGILSAQDLGVVYRQEVMKVDHDVCKLTVKINYWDHETWTYWYDTNGNVVQYSVQKFKGKDQPISSELVKLTPEGKMLTSSVTTFVNGKQTGIICDTCTEYNGGKVIEIPSPKLEYCYYKVPGKVDKKGNWLQISRSSGNYSQIISRQIEYHSAIPTSVKSELAAVNTANATIKANFEHKAEVAALEQAKAEKARNIIGLVLGLIFWVIFICLFMHIRNVVTHKVVKKSAAKPLNPKDFANETEFLYAKYVQNATSVTDQVTNMLNKSQSKLWSNDNYNSNKKSLYYKVLLVIFLWSTLLVTPAFLKDSDGMNLAVIVAGIMVIAAFGIAVWWIIWGIKFFAKNMLLNKTLSNNTVTVFTLLMVIFTGIFGIYPLMLSYMPKFFAIFICFVGLCFYYAFMFGGLTRGRCPKCHAYYETECLGEDFRGLKHETSREHSSTTKNDFTLTKTIRRDKTYEMYAKLWKCGACGHKWEYTGRRLISDKSTLENADLR